MALTLAAAGAVLGGIGYWIGLFDRPEFKYKENLLSSKEEIYVLLALCREKSIGQHVMRLLEGTTKAVDAAASSHQKDSSSLLGDVAVKYGCPEGTKSVSVGLYFDDPHKKGEPRWGLGWAVATNTFEEAKELAKTANELSGMDEKMVAVRIGPGPVVTGRIPWRSFLTPALVSYCLLLLSI